jgi:hypothetical protein
LEIVYGRFQGLERKVFVERVHLGRYTGAPDYDGSAGKELRKDRAVGEVGGRFIGYICRECAEPGVCRIRAESGKTMDNVY